MRKVPFVLVLILLPLLSCPAQAGPEPLPKGFRSITLGMSMEMVKEALKNDSLYSYEGDPEVSLLDTPPENLLETAGLSFIERAAFQFNEDSLYIIILFLNREKLDYFTMYTTLKAKYGPPKTLDPEVMVWEDDTVRMSLERPLSIKYIEKAVFGALIEKGMAEQSIEAYTRDKFLTDF